jgi:hypothetical protein
MSSRELLGILVMLNNYFHDLAVAVLLVSVLLGWLLWRELVKSRREAAPKYLLLRLSGGLATATRVSLVWIVLGGVVRALAYRDYEWLPAAGRGQIAALAIKHLLLVGLVTAGVYFQIKLHRRLSRWEEGEGR